MKCFYHTDNDGYCAGSLVYFYYKTFKPEANITPEDFIKYNYNGDPDLSMVSEGEELYFVDLSFKTNQYELVKEMSEKYNLTWIDHHKSSMDLLKKHPELDNIKGIRNEEASGAFLTYMYLWDVHSLDEIPYYVKLVSDYDIFTFNYGEQTTYFYLGTNTEDNNSCFSKLWSDLFYYNTKPLELIEKGRVIKKYVDHDNARYLNSYGFEAKIGVYKCYVVNRISNSWIFGEKYEEYPVVCVYAYDGERYKYTLYSNANSGIDCEAIAKSFGGGGHKHAAGFSLNYNLFDEQTHLDLK